MIYDLIVIGGGAAGFYGAIQLKQAMPGAKVIIVEKSPKLLSKVRISGGGRCNVTHHCFDRYELSEHYPRGAKPLKELFKLHQAKDVVDWFGLNGVRLKAEEDGRMFPVTDSSETIIECFMNEALHHKIKIELGWNVIGIREENGCMKVLSQTGGVLLGKKVLIAMGGSPSATAYEWIKDVGHTIAPLIPSLFTFNDSEKKFSDLMGVAVENGLVRIGGSKLIGTGPVLITHWGLSGPGVIKLSAWAAEYLHERRYQFQALISWIGAITEEETRAYLLKYKSERGKQKVISNPLFSLPQRLWSRLCELSEIDEKKIWSELPNKNINKLLEFLIRCPFNIKGKTTFKEEFVTCGGVDLKEVNLQTMESKIIPGVYFAGEVLNIDGETGGFNFQAAWTTSYVAALDIKKKLSAAL
jgi:predicted Rossmann fold flavoprotein